MLRQSGVIRVETVEQLMDVAQIVASQPLPAGEGIAVVSNSAALGKVLADAVAAQSMTVAAVIDDLDLDTGQSVALPALEAAVSAALADEAVHAAIVTTLPAVGLPAETIAARLQACGEAAGKPVIASFTGVLDPAQQLDGLVQDGAPDLGRPPADDARPGAGLQRGLPTFSSPGAAVAALGAVVAYTRWRSRDHGEFPELSGTDDDAAADQLEEILRRVSGVGLTRLTPEESSALLGHYGIPLLPSAAFDSADEAVKTADTLGWPVALKTTDEHLRHRLDLGGVRLGIEDAEALRANIVQMEKALAPFGSFGMEVQRMAPPGQACTLRAIEDPLLGPVLSFGLAGDAVNLLDDWSHSVPPLTAVDIADLVRAPRASRKLFGYQGLPPADIAAVEDLVARVALLKDNHPEIALLEFNPVLVSTTGLAILSAVIDVGNPRQRTDSARRAMRD
jgi:acyl-CoA synthetase (NDP forming)